MKDEDLFIDTGAWYALADKEDRFHESASSLLPRALKDFRRFVTTNLIIAETYILIRKALGHQPAIAFLDKTSTSPNLTKVYSEPMIEEEAEIILRTYGDQTFSYTDAVSFVVMKKKGIQKAFAFDKHFVTAGFTVIPQPHMES